MYAERVILETDASGQIKAWPKLPVNKRFEAIFLVLDSNDDEAVAVQPRPSRRHPSPALAGRIEVTGDVIDSAPAADWDLLT